VVGLLRCLAGACRSPKTRAAYRRALEDLLAFTNKWPWEILPNDVQAWVNDMQARKWHNPATESAGGEYGQEGVGLSPATIAQRMAATSSFYTYAGKRFWAEDAQGEQRPLADRNPVTAVPRPKVEAFGQASYLDQEQVIALLRAIPRDTPKRLQAYALILTYLLTGRRNRAICTLCWCDLRRQGSLIYYRWSNKGKTRWDLLPPPAWHAIEAYLEAAGRLKAMRDGDYIFAPLSDQATHLPGVDGETWTRHKPLWAAEVGRMVKRHAREAGLDPSQIRVHTLRHTAAELYRRHGDDIYTVSKLLAHSSVNVTRGYFDHMEGHENVTWQKVAEGCACRRSGRERPPPTPPGGGREERPR
jgi:integrase